MAPGFVVNDVPVRGANTAIVVHFLFGVDRFHQSSGESLGASSGANGHCSVQKVAYFLGSLLRSVLLQ